MRKLIFLSCLITIIAAAFIVPREQPSATEPSPFKTGEETGTPAVTPELAVRPYSAPTPIHAEREAFVPPQDASETAPDEPGEPAEQPSETAPSQPLAQPEPDEHSTGPTSRPEPATESKPSEPSVNEPSSVVPQSGSGLPGFDYVPYLGPNVVIYVEDMYENGNKIGIMGDINKQVGIMD